MSIFSLDPEKTIEAAATLISLNGGSINYTLLIKMLYYADRISMERYDHPITGDNFCSMDRGPVLSRVYNCIKLNEQTPSELEDWDEFIETTGFNVTLNKNPGDMNLSEAEDRILAESYTFLKAKYDEFQNKNDFYDFIHDFFPEWEDPKGSSRPLRDAKVFRQLGKSHETIQSIKAFQSDFEEIESILG